MRPDRVLATAGAIRRSESIQLEPNVLNFGSTRFKPPSGFTFGL
jgi:hypothetical protein